MYNIIWILYHSNDKIEERKYPHLVSKIIVPRKLWKTYENDNKFFLLYLLVQSSASIMILTSSLEKDKKDSYRRNQTARYIEASIHLYEDIIDRFFCSISSHKGIVRVRETRQPVYFISCHLRGS